MSMGTVIMVIGDGQMTISVDGIRNLYRLTF